MRRYFLTFEDANNESLRLGELIHLKNQFYLDEKGEGKIDITIKWDEPQEDADGWSMQDHPDMQGYIE
jgi:hypothetical protein